MKRIIVSGGFDPLHVGHLNMMEKARSLGEKLIVVLNNDNWLHLKKKYVFMPEKERKHILSSLRFVDEVILTSHKKDEGRICVCKELEKLRKKYPKDQLVFVNAADRVKKTIPEVDICKELDIKRVYIRFKKKHSSSKIVERAKAIVP